MTYPLFDPPPGLQGKDYRSWSTDQARSYFEWLMSEWHHRVRFLLDDVGAEPGTGETLLAKTDNLVLRRLGDADFSSGHKLSAQGRAVAADFGLLFARELILSCPTIRWDIGRGPKTDVAFNLPVLVGFGGASLDPIRTGISHYGWIVAGNMPRHTWAEIFEYWRNRAWSAARQ